MLVRVLGNFIARAALIRPMFLLFGSDGSLRLELVLLFTYLIIAFVISNNLPLLKVESKRHVKYVKVSYAVVD